MSNHFWITQINQTVLLCYKLLRNACLIANLATSLKNKDHNVSISNIVLRTDNQELREKALTVNKELSEICRERSLYLIDNSKKIKQQHLNKGKLHLNQKGVRILSDMYLREISKILN